MRANKTCVWNLSNPSLFPVLLCAPSLRSSRVSRLYYFILFSLELENATSACSLQIARQLTDHSRVFIFIHEANLRGISFNLSIILFFFSKKWISFRPSLFFSKDICSLFLSKESRDAANRNEANLRIARMSYVMHEDNKSLCRMIVRVILAKRWNTFKKGRSQTKLKWIRAWRRCSLNQSVSSFIL